jgi:hypothetical protein
MRLRNLTVSEVLDLAQPIIEVGLVVFGLLHWWWGEIDQAALNIALAALSGSGRKD